MRTTIMNALYNGPQPTVHSFSPPPSTMFPPHHHHLPHQIHLFPHNPYTPSPPPPPIAHKVWILDCKSCGSFLTNRGMKVRAWPAHSTPCLIFVSYLGSTFAEAECVPVLIGCLAGELFGVHIQPRCPAPGVPLPALLILAAIAYV